MVANSLVRLYRNAGGQLLRHDELPEEFRAMPRLELENQGLFRDPGEQVLRWLAEQSNDTKFLFALHIPWHWDDPEAIRFLDDPSLDLTIAALAFWKEGSDSLVYDYGFVPSNVKRFLSNFENGYYRSTDLELNRCDIIDEVQFYVGQLRKLPQEKWPKVPRVLFGPFTGRRAVASPTIDAETVAELKDAFQHWGARPEIPFPASYAEHAADEFRRWPEATGFLPAITRELLAELDGKDDLTYLEGIYGKHEDFALARKTALECTVRNFGTKHTLNHAAGNRPWTSEEASLKRRKFAKLLLLVLILGVIAIGLGLLGHRVKTGYW